LELEDTRATNDFTSSLGSIPLVLWAGYRQSVWDKNYRSRIPAAFRDAIPNAVAEELQGLGAFDSVVRVETMEEARKHPFIARGKLLEASLNGRVWTYGLSFLRTWLYTIALPHRTRHWKIDVQYEVVESTQLRPVVATSEFKVVSDSRTLTQYGNRYDISEFDEAVDNLAAAIAVHIASKIPPSGSRELASLTTAHKRYAAEQRALADLASRIEPPVITVASPRDGQEFRSGNIPLNWSVDAAGRMKAVSLTQNGQKLPLTILQRKLTGDRSTAPGVHSEVSAIDLKMGANTLELEVTDFLDQTSRFQIEVTRLPKRLDIGAGKRLAFVAGVSSYSAAGLSDLQSPGANNARKFSDFLVDPYGGQMPPGNVETLTGAEVTRERFMQELSDISRDAIAGDTLIVYFSGLSVSLGRRGPAYLLVSGSDPNNLANTAVSVDDLKNALGDSLADNTLFILDAAYGTGPYEANAQGFLVQASRRLGNLGVWVSTDRGSASFDPNGQTFTSLLLGSLGKESDLDNDGRLNLEEVAEAIRSSATDAGLPTPRLEGRYDSKLPLKMLE
jgi:hypothetical protein